MMYGVPATMSSRVSGSRPGRPRWDARQAAPRKQGCGLHLEPALKGCVEPIAVQPRACPVRYTSGFRRDWRWPFRTRLFASRGRQLALLTPGAQPERRVFMRYNAVRLDVFLSLSDGGELPLLIFHIDLKSVSRKPGAAASRSVDAHNRIGHYLNTHRDDGPIHDPA